MKETNWYMPSVYIAPFELLVWYGCGCGWSGRAKIALFWLDECAYLSLSVCVCVALVNLPIT